jgi:hypothetical protein
MTDDKYVTMSQHMAKSRHSREEYRNPQKQAVTVKVFQPPAYCDPPSTLQTTTLLHQKEGMLKITKLHLFQEM